MDQGIGQLGDRKLRRTRPRPQHTHDRVEASAQLNGTLLCLGTFVLATAVELVCKTVITRPALYGVSDGTLVHLAGFDSSFPSGHVVRGALLVAAVAGTWPFLRPCWRFGQ